MTTIRDVAKKADVSPATISRYLAQDGNFKVSAETANRIDEAISTLNYIHVPRKRRKQYYKVGIIMAQTSEKYSDPFFNSILNSIEEQCTKLNIQVINIVHYSELTKNNLNAIYEHDLDGIFLLEELPDEYLTEIHEQIKNVIGIDFESNNFNTIGFDVFNSTIKAFDYLMSKGHRRVAFIGGGSASKHFQQTTKVASYHECMRRLGKKKYAHLLLDTNWELDRVVHSTKELFQQDPMPDAIFAASDTIASIILSIAYEQKIKVPEDISILGFNDIPNSAFTIPPLSTVHVPTTLMGRLAVKRMFEVINGDTDIYQTLVNTNIIERKSVKSYE